MTVQTTVDLLKYRRTKIVATLGPASHGPDMIGRLIDAGTDVFRVNFSHGTHAEHAAVISTIRDVAQGRRAHIGILADLCGPKIRCGKFTGAGIELIADSELIVTTRDVMGGPDLIPSQYRSLHADVRPGNRILLADGAVELAVLSVAGTEVTCRVVTGGRLSDHKGINLPGVEISAPSLTDKDHGDAEFALEAGVDFIALSFVRSSADVLALKELIAVRANRARVIAKIEKPEALTNIDTIISVADGIMVARGDLGVELPPEQVPLAQSQLIAKAKSANRPVIVATQMLESMIENPRPTRAEVSDVSSAVVAGADAIMLSGESAIGQYPVAAVEMMDRIARQTETYQQHENLTAPRVATNTSDTPFGDAIADTVAHLVYAVQARAVMVITQQGMSAVTISAGRPGAPIIGVSSSPQTCRAMQLMWGVVPHLARDVGQVNPNAIAKQLCDEITSLRGDDYVVLVRGFSGDKARNTPTITLLSV